MRLRSKKGQNTLEYVIVLTAVVGLIIWAAATMMRPKIEQGYTDVNDSLTNTATMVAP